MDRSMNELKTNFVSIQGKEMYKRIFNIFTETNGLLKVNFLLLII
jgi:hypothetical protein